MVAGLLAANLFAENLGKVRNHEIAIDPLGFLGGNLPLSFRLGLNDNVALGIHGEARFYGWNRYTRGFGGGLGVSAKFFLSAPTFQDSWYVEPSLMVHYYSLQDSRAKFWNISPSVVGGYGWVWDSGFSLNLGLGVQYSYAFIDHKVFGDATIWDIHGFGPTGDFSLGFVW